MKPETKEFRSKAAQTLEDKTVLQSLEHVYTGFHEGRLKAAADTPDWEDLRTKGKAIKDHTIAHLDYYLGLLADNVEKNDGHVFFADDAAEARKHIIDLAHTREIKTVIKSKSISVRSRGARVKVSNSSIFFSRCVTSCLCVCAMLLFS